MKSRRSRASILAEPDNAFIAAAYAEKRLSRQAR
jgi:hypothetical protein